MKTIKTIILFSGMSLSSNFAQSQTTAMNFDILDCNSVPHNLFGDLDSGKCVIIEFFMTSCGSCITAGGILESMKTDLMAEFPGMIKAYAFGFNNSYSCATVNNWVMTNGITSFPSDSGAAQVAYYGGMGMPTIVILGGVSSHLLLSAPYIGFTTSDTITMASDIRNFLNGTSITENNNLVNELMVFPNPANSEVKVSFNLTESNNVTIDVIDLTGRVVTNVMNEKVQSGTITKTINTSTIAEGNYLISVNVNGTVSQQKLSIVH